MTDLRNLVINILLVIAGTCAGLLLAEAVMAVLYPQPVIHGMAPNIFFVTYDKDIGWVNRQGAQGTYRPDPAFPPVMVRINSLGYRGKAHSLKKEPGRERILVLGDSNAFGYGVEEKERFSEVLSENLPKKYEVLNLGVFGYGTDQEMLLFARDGMLYGPDVVVLAFSAADLTDNMSSVNGGNNKPFFRTDGKGLVLFNNPVPETTPLLRSSSRKSLLKNFLYTHSHLYRLMLQRLMSLNRYMSNSVMEMTEDEGMRTTIGIIRELNSACRENGSRLVVLLIPHGYWINALQGGSPSVGYFPLLKSGLSGIGIPVIDSTDDLVNGSRSGSPVFFTHDPVHLTPSGHKIVAESLLRGLAGLEFVSPE